MTDEPALLPPPRAKPPGFWTGKRIAIAVVAGLLLLMIFGGNEESQIADSEDQGVTYGSAAQPVEAQAGEGAVAPEVFGGQQQDAYAQAPLEADASPTPTETLDAGDMIETELSNSVVY
jgi:hypothetical protein